MIIAMLLAHLVGDYVLQWEALANWKARSIKGAVCHGSIVLTVTMLLALAIDPAWWPWVLLIGLAHILIDSSWTVFNRHFVPRSGLFGLARLLIDQTLHFSVIVCALCASGLVTLPALPAALVNEIQTHRMWAIALGYTFISMPAWIFIEFVFYGLINGSAPDFSRREIQIRGQFRARLDRDLCGDGAIHTGASGCPTPSGAGGPAVHRQQSHNLVSGGMVGQSGGGSADRICIEQTLVGAR